MDRPRFFNAFAIAATAALTSLSLAPGSRAEVAEGDQAAVTAWAIRSLAPAESAGSASAGATPLADRDTRYAEPTPLTPPAVALASTPQSVSNPLRGGKVDAPATLRAPSESPTRLQVVAEPVSQPAAAVATQPATSSRYAFDEPIALEATPAATTPIKTAGHTAAPNPLRADAEPAVREPIGQEPVAQVPIALAQALPPEPQPFAGVGQSQDAEQSPKAEHSVVVDSPPNALSDQRVASRAPVSHTFEPNAFEAPRGADSTRSITPPQPLQQEPLRLGFDEPSSRSTAGVAGGLGAGRPGDASLEGPQQASVVIQKLTPREIQVGKPCRFAVLVRNTGAVAAEGVEVRDQTPAGARMINTTPPAVEQGDALTWRLGRLAPGEERTLEMELMPTDEGEIGSVASVSFASQASGKVRCTRPQLALRLSTAKTVRAGKKHKVSIEMHNPGTGDATGVMLLANVPENLSHPAGPALEMEIGTLRAGETRTIDLMLGAERAGQVASNLVARADGNLQTEASATFEVIAPELKVAVDGPSRRYLEHAASYTISIDNPGTAAAQDVRLVSHLPDGMKFVKANNMGEYDESTHSVYWSLAELPEGQRGEVELVAMPVTPGDHALRVESEAQEGLRTSETQRVLVEGIAAIKFEVLDRQDPIEVGGETTYQVRVVNQGTKAAERVRVVVDAPEGMRVVNAKGESRHSLSDHRAEFEPLATLAPKASALFFVRLEGTQPGDQRVTVSVETADHSKPIRREESTRVFGDE
ncbi:Large cysteine-rich periplasmic protein OmcB precursor [Pseudobythopirellula maris]|uniref:Large cysteine-rich periplasmic protein OmcB n=1 Tax=Pseudobythopirellula maris TaxID=2527991 RepID=A0A5C5ZNM0_9BACT|nr:DUF11 domain-containing protein [Pseudobythopirellula maris]TWT88778.1 Large cysteine-rich periplasmic protein OmcB precursor [Pseudobythopirellula maris]